MFTNAQGRLILYVILVIGFCCVDNVFASGSSLIKQGQKAYINEEYEEAEHYFQEASDKIKNESLGNYNLGTVLYKQEKYESAIQEFEKTLLTDDDNLRTKAYYNLGNALYKYGITQEEKDIGLAIKNLEEAVQHYESAAILDGNDDDIVENKKFVTEELERLRQKKQENEQNQQQNQQEDQQESQDQQDKEDQESSDNKNQPDDQQSSNEQSADDKESDDNKNKSSDSSEQKEAQDQQKEESSGKKKSLEDEQNTNSDNENSEQQKQEQPSQEELEDQINQAEDNKESLENRKDSENADSEKNTKPEDASRPMQQKQLNVDLEEMTDFEAQMLIDSYNQGEAPQKLLNFYKGTGKNKPVLKDW